MKINNENEDQQPEPKKEEKSGYVDTAYMTVQCHLLIKDKDTGEVLVNRRG